MLQLVDLIKQESFGKAVGILNHQINVVDLKDAASKEFRHIDEFQDIVRIIT